MFSGQLKDGRPTTVEKGRCQRVSLESEKDVLDLPERFRL